MSENVLIVGGPVFVCIGATVGIYMVLIKKFVPTNNIWGWGENCPMGKVETMERVKCMASFQGVWHPCRERGGKGVLGVGGVKVWEEWEVGFCWQCITLSEAWEKGWGWGCSAWVRANIVTVPKLGWVLGWDHSSHRQICGKIKEGFSFAALPTDKVLRD